MPSISPPIPRFIRVLTIAAFAAVAMTPWVRASAAKLRVIHSFCAEANCADGSQPHGDLLADPSGNLFGTAAAGGASGAGVAFELHRNSNTGKWKYKTLYSFCTKTNCNDGVLPIGKLIRDTGGNLYGVTYSRVVHGGGGGVVFELSPGARQWKEKTLHKFCSKADCADGAGATGGLTYEGAQTGAPYDGVSPLYGITAFGGATGQGAVFSLTPVPGAPAWKEQVIHDFCTETDDCGLEDGAEPAGAPIMDGSGNLLGATAFGGVNFGGTLFELSPGGGKRWNATTLYAFCAGSCADGAMPNGVVMGASGSLYGLAQQFGANNGGVVFELTHDGAYSVLHDFCDEADCADGRQALANVTIDASGNLFGTTIAGGGNDTDENHEGGGVVFTAPNGGGYSTLHSFCAEAACADGEYPLSGITVDTNGHLFGETSAGGKFGEGVVFEVTP